MQARRIIRPGVIRTSIPLPGCGNNPPRLQLCIAGVALGTSAVSGTHRCALKFSTSLPELRSSRNSKSHLLYRVHFTGEKRKPSNRYGVFQYGYRALDVGVNKCIVREERQALRCRWNFERGLSHWYRRRQAPQLFRKSRTEVMKQAIG